MAKGELDYRANKRASEVLTEAFETFANVNARTFLSALGENRDLGKLVALPLLGLESHESLHDLHIQTTTVGQILELHDGQRLSVKMYVPEANSGIKSNYYLVEVLIKHRPKPQLKGAVRERVIRHNEEIQVGDPKDFIGIRLIYSLLDDSKRELELTNIDILDENNSAKIVQNERRWHDFVNWHSNIKSVARDLLLAFTEFQNSEGFKAGDIVCVDNLCISIEDYQRDERMALVSSDTQSEKYTIRLFEEGTNDPEHSITIDVPIILR